MILEIFKGIVWNVWKLKLFFWIKEVDFMSYRTMYFLLTQAVA